VAPLRAEPDSGIFDYGGRREDAEAVLAKETGRVLASNLRDDDLMRLRIIGPSPQTVRLPAAAARLLVRILEEMARGNLHLPDPGESSPSRRRDSRTSRRHRHGERARLSGACSGAVWDRAAALG
jgi:hypothetical protein